MSYKKHQVKNCFIKWDKNIFPVYQTTSGSRVSQKRINRLKPILKTIIVEEFEKIRKAFYTFAKKRYNGKQIRVHLDLEKMLLRCDNIFVCKKDDIYGESDEDGIWIAKEKMNDSILLGTMLHESLHFCCTFNKQWICSSDEHQIMSLLGEVHEC